MTLAPGTLIAQRFLIASVGGSGGMGTVYRASDICTGLHVALKLLNLADDAQEPLRFAREAALLAKLRHPGIVAYVAHGAAEQNQHFLAMEWLEGEDLSQRLSRSSLRLSEGLALLRRAAEALCVVHEHGVVHRDLKPSNLFLRDGQVERTTLLDFGIARRGERAEAVTGTGLVVGSPGYMAPEQARGERDISPSADIFSLGCVLYESLTGRPPFWSEHLAAALAKILFEEPPRLCSLRPDVPEAVEALLHWMLAKDPEQRPRDAKQLLTALAVLGGVAAPCGALSATAATAALTISPEQRLVSVILATPASLPSDGSKEPEQRQQLSALRDALRDVLSIHEAQGEWLADGSLIATLSQRRDEATDQAARAARCAVALKARWPEATIALSTGRGVITERLPVGEALDRAGQTLRAGSGQPSSTARTTPILLDEVTARLIEARFQVRRERTGVLALQGEEERADASRPLLGRPTPCFGREQELGILESLFRASIDDAMPHAALVTAPPGMGKSRLRHEFLRRLSLGGRDVEILMAQGDPIRAGSPYGLIAQALRRLCGVSGGEDEARRRDKLLGRVTAHLPGAEALRVAEFIGELCGVPFPDEERVKLRAARSDPRVMSDQIRQAFIDLLRATCAARPVLLVLEDLHWGDVLTAKLVEAALRELPDQPLMVLALARPEVTEQLPELLSRQMQILRLHALSKRACEQLVRQALGEEASVATAARLVEQCDGNALLLEELIRATAAHGREAMPDTVLAMLQARIGNLDFNARRVLRAASVFGQTFWHGGVLAILSVQGLGEEVRACLELLTRHEIIEARRESRFPGETEYRFRHALMRDAAYSLLTDTDSALAHRLAGRYLERMGEPDAVVLAEHACQGGELERAVPFFIRGDARERVPAGR